MKKPCIFLLFFLVICQVSVLAAERLRFEHITNKDGLSHNTVRGIMQDSRGFMWISTINGLNRYDGHQFLSLHPEFNSPSLTENNIRRTLEDHAGRIWIQSTSLYVDCYDTNTESFVDYTGKGLSRNYSDIAVMPDGEVWLWGPQNGACRIRYVENHMSATFYDANNIGTDAVAFVHRESSGRLWIGTDRGLLRVGDSGPEFCQPWGRRGYRSVVEQRDRLCFFTDRGGVVLFDKRLDSFLPSAEEVVPPGFQINHTAALDDSRVLITGNQGVLVLHTDTLETRSAHSLFSGETPADARIIVDNRQNIWVHNNTGCIWQYIKERDIFEPHRLIPPEMMSVIDAERFDVFADSRGITWITTYGNGLFTLDSGGGIRHFEAADNGLKSNYLLSVSEDRTGEIWVGTANDGIIKISLTAYDNTVFTPAPRTPDPSDRAVRSIYEDRATGNLWIGTKGGHVYVCDSALNHRHTFPLRQGAAYTIVPDSGGNVWVGTKGDGILVVPQGATHMSECYTHRLSESQSGEANNIYALLCDRQGRMWVGTFGNGLYVYELRDGRFEGRRFPVLSARQRYIRCLIQDSAGMIWAGGSNGIVLFDPEELLRGDENFDWFRFDKNDPRSLNNDVVKTICQDAAGRVWIGTSGGGLNLAVRESATGRFKFRHYASEQGLGDNMVQAILEDNDGKLWISTENSISRLSPEDMFFENFRFPDTSQSALFSEAAACKRYNGELLFGSAYGMHIFDPAFFETHFASPPVTLTGLSINGIPVRPNTPDSPLTESLAQTRAIRLRHGQNSFAVSFSSLNYQSSQSNRYTWILENYDRQWNPVTSYNQATYKNVPPGRYLLRVANANSRRPDGGDTRLEIVVVPPFWKSTKALILYLVLILAAVFFTVKLIARMNRLHNEVEVERQMTEYKLRFFTNISHEFRTPLTIIRGCIENMGRTAAPSPVLAKQIGTLEKSSEKLMRLVDQLLEFRKMQNEQMDLRLEETEAVGFTGGICDLFAETAEKKRIDFRFTPDRPAHTLLLDRGKWERILFNLLSNAFRHTPEGGRITVALGLDEVGECLELKVSDSGPGIPPEKQHLLFTRFAQIHYSPSGIGIGLNLTAELTCVHRGEIDYQTSEWGGACFSIRIPARAEAYAPEEIARGHGAAIDDRELLPAITQAVVPEEEADESETVAGEKVRKRGYKVLLIEDDEVIRQFLTDQLSEYFTVVTAPDGAAGLKAAYDDQPELIVCDVMMPLMDGFEVTKRLKSDFRTSHIPIVLLTAHVSIEHQLEGINAGADAYITKPFSTAFLVSRIARLIEQRKKLQYKFSREPGFGQAALGTTDKDQEFLDKIHDIVERRLGDANFSIDDFARQAGMGRTLFYKKVKGITGYPPNEYLRIARLKKAAELLRTTELNISEVAYRIGFNDPDYFSKCFKDLFGMKPTQFR